MVRSKTPQKHRRKSPLPSVAPPTPPFSFPTLIKSSFSAVAENLDTLMVLAGVMHILLGLVFMGMAAEFNGGLSNGAVFGKESSDLGQKEQEPLKPKAEKKIRAISPPAVLAFCAFTLALWGLLIARRRKMTDRQIRFLALFYSFGTLTAIYSIGQWIFT